SRVGKAPLPVLKRGAKDRGSGVLTAPLAVLSGLRFPNQKPSAELGDTVTLLGEHLKSENTTVQLQHPLLDEPIFLQPESGQNEKEITIQLPDDPGTGADWPTGFYALSLLVEYPDPADPNKTDLLEWTSNQLYMPLAPQLTITDVHLAPAPSDDTFRTVTLTVHCIPQMREEQEAALLFSDRIIQPEQIVTPLNTPADPTMLKFIVKNVPAKLEPYTVVVRLRVDGIDSIPIVFPDPTDPPGTLPRFVPDQKVTII
ncbi:MAG: hypothetical protein D3923_15150, partial [Candidatus Electrothrix sp. AR3]|nr:hypothetical protein [Candidatus Electrothrix sp. AR3]